MGGQAFAARKEREFHQEADAGNLGTGFLGHDNFRKTYQNVWIDNFSSGYTISEGKAGDDGKSLSLTYVWEGPMGKMPGRLAYTLIEGGYKLEGWMSQGDQEMKHMEIIFMRCKPTKR